MVWWLSPRAFQTVTKELDFIFFKLQKIKRYKEIIIWKFFERNFARNCVKNGFFFQNNFVENSLICPKDKSASHCPIELFPIYPNIHWTIRQRYRRLVIQPYWRLTEFMIWYFLHLGIHESHSGIAHTRWATHGVPSELNSHPHTSGEDNEFIVVHNGIITNYKEVKVFLERKGMKFISETDTEVISKLIKYMYTLYPDSSLCELVEKTIMQLEGKGKI